MTDTCNGCGWEGDVSRGMPALSEHLIHAHKVGADEAERLRARLASADDCCRQVPVLQAKLLAALRTCPHGCAYCDEHHDTHAPLPRVENQGQVHIDPDLVGNDHCEWCGAPAGGEECDCPEGV